MHFFNKLKQNINNRKYRKICLNQAYFSGGEIYRLLQYDTLKNLVNNIKPGQIELASNLLFGKKIITNEEQFFYILNKYITFIRDNIYIDTNELVAIIEETLKSNYSNILFCKLDFTSGNNYIIYYNEFKKMLLDNLLHNYNLFYKDIYNKDILNLNNLSLDNEKDLDVIFLKFKDIINYKRKKMFYYFEKINLTDNFNYRKDFYIVHWNTLITNYINTKQSG